MLKEPRTTKKKPQASVERKGSRSISIQANAPYVDAVHVLARRRSTTSAALVREALDKLLGEELKECIAFIEGSHA